MKYRICPLCGSNLDHGEICTCQDDRDEAMATDRSAAEYADTPTLKGQQPEPVLMPGA